MKLCWLFNVICPGPLFKEMNWGKNWFFASGLRSVWTDAMRCILVCYGFISIVTHLKGLVKICWVLCWGNRVFIGQLPGSNPFLIGNIRPLWGDSVDGKREVWGFSNDYKSRYPMWRFSRSYIATKLPTIHVSQSVIQRSF